MDIKQIESERRELVKYIVRAVDIMEHERDGKEYYLLKECLKKYRQYAYPNTNTNTEAANG